MRIARVLPVAYGVVERFLLYGEFDDDVFATGGDVEVRLEPRSLYDDVKIFPLAKLDRLASLTQIKRCIDDEEGRLVCVWSMYDLCICNLCMVCGCLYVCGLSKFVLTFSSR